jgi:hypothetical protein
LHILASVQHPRLVHLRSVISHFADHYTLTCLNRGLTFVSADSALRGSGFVAKAHQEISGWPVKRVRLIAYCLVDGEAQKGEPNDTGAVGVNIFAGGGSAVPCGETGPAPMFGNGVVGLNVLR